MLKITARVAAHWNTMAAEPEQWAARRAQLLETCEAVGRDPEEITQSVMTPLLPGQDPRELADKAVRFGEVGADLVVVNLPNPLRPDVLEQLGEALAPLA
jgi:alkanesulfonate monooxygenase SsuD/methylene tetrahydromethanopterin reductase-like flavin-dependent oxidoreductase (luciferase family)